MEVINQKVVKTRKAHYCMSCCRKFEAKTMMHNQVNVHDGHINSIYWCETCDALMKVDSPMFKDCYGQFWEGCVADHLGKGQSPEDLLLELTPRGTKTK